MLAYCAVKFTWLEPDRWFAFSVWFLLLVAVIILNSYPLPQPRSGDLTQVRDAQRMLVQESHIGAALRDHVAPAFVHILGPLLPSDVVSIFP